MIELLDLPPEMLSKILKMLDLEALIKFGLCSQECKVQVHSRKVLSGKTVKRYKIVNG